MERRGGGGLRPIREVPDALERSDDIRARLRRREPVVFLDYDGTLTPIVDDPDRARLPAETRRALERLRDLCRVAVVSGRDLPDVRRRVGVRGLHYAGSHGFDVLTPDGERRQRGQQFLPALARAERRLAPLLEEIDGAHLERKGFALAVHYRTLAEPSDRERVEAAVDRVCRDVSRVRKSGGKKVFELRPDVDWDKGEAVRSILDDVGQGPGELRPVYVGDDVTDEDAFRSLGEDGMAVVVRGEDDDRKTVAGFSLADPQAVRDFLLLIADTLERRGSAVVGESDAG